MMRVMGLVSTGDRLKYVLRSYDGVELEHCGAV